MHKPGKFNVADPLSRNPSFRIASAILAVTTRSRLRTVETASRSASDTATAAEPPAKRARTEASTSADVTDESDVVSRSAAA